MVFSRDVCDACPLFDENNVRSFQAKGEEEKLRSEEEKKDLLTAF
jgi:hypothetical protein